MKVINSIKKIFRPRLELVRGTRFVSFLFIAFSVIIAAGILWAANMYYNIDTGEVVTEQIYRVTGVLRATAGAIVGGSATQNPATGYGFEVVGSTRLATTTIATGPVELIAANQVLKFTGGISDYYVGFRANTSATSGQAITYTFPAAPPTEVNYVLSSSPTGVWSWQSVSGVGAGDITAVGDVSSGEAFTATLGTQYGNTLWFHPNATYLGALTVDSALAANATYTLPVVSGTIALGTGTANYVAYWTGTNTLASEAQLATTRGGTGADTSGWSGMVKVVGGTWGVANGTAGYAAYWSDANTIAPEQYLSVSRGGTGAGSFTQYGALYGMGTAALGVTAAGATNQLLVSGGGAAAPSWANIANLITATNGLTESGTTALTLKLGGTLTEITTIALGDYNMIFNMTGLGDFIVQDAGTNILTVTDDGRILFKTYPLAESGKEILRGMIPILGFDLPAQTATTSYVQISRKVNACDFPSSPAGATRVYKFVIRYTDNLPTASSTNWQVSTSTGVAYSTFTLPGQANSDLDTGTVKIVQPNAPGVPCDTYPWWLEVQSLPPYPDNKIKVFQIFLAAFDRID